MSKFEVDDNKLEKAIFSFDLDNFYYAVKNKQLHIFRKQKFDD